MRLFLAVLLLFFVCILSAKADIDWETATVEDVQKEINTNNNADEEFLTKLLVEACAKSRNLDIIDELIGSGAKIDKKVIHNVTYNNKFRADLISLSEQGKDYIDKEALKEASIKEHSLMQKLFEKRVDKETEPNFGLEEWWLMAWIPDIKKELDSGADINGVYDGYTPLQMALIMHREYNTIKFLIDKGADVNGETTVLVFVPLSLTPLHIAVENSSLDVVELLLKSGANVNISEKYEQGLLFDLCRKPFENEERINLLLKYGADFNEKTKSGWTVLEGFVAGGELNLVKWWIKKGASVPKDILAKEWIYLGDKVTPEIVDFLVEHGADVNANYDYSGIIYTPLSAVVYRSHRPELIDKLVELGADVNAIVQYDQTALFMAVEYEEDVAMVEALLKNGANVNIRDYRGATALDKSTKEELKELLIKYGAK